VQKNISSKLPKTALSIFEKMTSLADSNSAINLAQGFPDFKPDPKLVALVTKHIKAGNNQYAPVAGVMPLRQAIARQTRRNYKADYDPISEITITNGATQAIYTAISAFIREGNEVIVFEPAYESYIPSIRVNQGIAKTIELKAPDFRINWNEVKRVISINTRMIILNSPHNPTGMMLDREDIAQLVSLVADKEILVLSDEVYEHIRFDGREHLSLAGVPALRDQCLVINSFGKSTHTTGWKIGYCLAPGYLTAEFRKIHQNMVFSVNTPIQFALSEFLEDETRFDYIPDFYQEKRDYFSFLLKDTGFITLPCAGTYFQLASYEGLSDKIDKEFSVDLTTTCGVATIPLSSFYMQPRQDKILRFCFAKTTETLEKAAKNLLVLQQ